MRRRHRVLCAAATLCALGGLPAFSRAGVKDTPLPTFSDGKAAKLAFVIPAVIDNNNLETDVACTNLSAAPVDVGLEVFDQNGVRGNTIASGNGARLNLARGRTVTIGTGSTQVLHEDVVIALEAPVTGLRNGSARVVATSLQLACAAFAVDKFHTVQDPINCPPFPQPCPAPPTLLSLPIPCDSATVTCPARDQCHDIGTCKADGSCTNPAKPNGTGCDDGNACTSSDTCQGGVCRGTCQVGTACGSGCPAMHCAQSGSTCSCQ